MAPYNVTASQASVCNFFSDEVKSVLCQKVLYLCYGMNKGNCYKFIPSRKENTLAGYFFCLN